MEFGLWSGRTAVTFAFTSAPRSRGWSVSFDESVTKEVEDQYCLSRSHMITLQINTIYICQILTLNTSNNLGIKMFYSLTLIFINSQNWSNNILPDLWISRFNEEWFCLKWRKMSRKMFPDVLFVVKPSTPAQGPRFARYHLDRCSLIVNKYIGDLQRSFFSLSYNKAIENCSIIPSQENCCSQNRF